MTTRHEFLQEAHNILRPKVYLETGVQHGWSLDLAIYSTDAIGIDPHPLVQRKGNQRIYEMTSDAYFAPGWPVTVNKINMGFIDGMHLAEYALRDFLNIEKHSAPDAVVFFDDVLPRNQEEAHRKAPSDPVVGDWTGDVWAVYYWLKYTRKDLELTLINTQPTGLLMVRNLDPKAPAVPGQDKLAFDAEPVPDEIINRSLAIDPAAAIEMLLS